MSAGRLARLAAGGLLLLAAASCRSTEELVQRDLATARVVNDFDSYQFRRVGLLPFAGRDLTTDRAEILQSAFYAELSRSTDFEIVPLSAADVLEVPHSDPVRKGWYEPETILALARRYRLDGLLVGTAIDVQSFAPQKLSLQLELVSAETGAAVWTAAVHLDGGDERVVRALRARARKTSDEQEDIVLLSPRAFARFAAEEIAKLL